MKRLKLGKGIILFALAIQSGGIRDSLFKVLLGRGLAETAPHRYGNSDTTCYPTDGH
jgi:hypothetical protein